MAGIPAAVGTKFAALGTAGKFGIVGLGVAAGAGIAMATVTAASSILRSIFQGKADGPYQSQGAGIGGATGQDGQGQGTWKDFGWAIQNPVRATINSGYAVADAATLHKIPALGKARLEATSTNAYDIGNKIARGQYDASFAANFAGDVIGGTLTPEEKAMLAYMDPKDRARYLLQKKMQEKAEMAALCSNLQGLRHSCAQQIIGNIR